MLYIVIPKSLTTFVPIIRVPDFNIGTKVIDELKVICPGEIFTMVSGNTEYSEVKDYTNWKWNFNS